MDNKLGQEMRISDEELRLLKSVFADNDALLKLLRKVFLPELSPDAVINIKARNQLIQHIEMQLITLKHLAGIKKESVEETKERLKRDSAK